MKLRPFSMPFFTLKSHGLFCPKKNTFDDLMYTIKLKEKYSHLTTKTFKALQGLDVAANDKKKDKQISILKFLMLSQLEP